MLALFLGEPEGLGVSFYMQVIEERIEQGDIVFSQNLVRRARVSSNPL